MARFPRNRTDAARPSSAAGCAGPARRAGGLSAGGYAGASQADDLARRDRQVVDFSAEFEADLADLKRLIQEAGNPET